jgi:hypothetical protein
MIVSSLFILEIDIYEKGDLRTPDRNGPKGISQSFGAFRMGIF